MCRLAPPQQGTELAGVVGGFPGALQGLFCLMQRIFVLGQLGGQFALCADGGLRQGSQPLGQAVQVMELHRLEMFRALFAQGG